MKLDATRLYVRVDASAEMGVGHFMRCLSLAEYWKDQGDRVTFIGRYPDALCQRLQAGGIQLATIPASYPDAEDLRLTLKALPTAVPVVLDGYHFASDYQQRLAASGRRLLIIDDTGNLPEYKGDVLLNQNLDADRIDYTNAPAKRLLGVRFALLGRQFRKCARAPSKTPGRARRLLVTLGGADPDNCTLTIMKALDNGSVGEATIRVVAGPANKHRESLHAFCKARQGRFELISDATDMPAQMAWAELAVAAAGSTSWELAFMGVPSVLVSIADNQVGIGDGLARLGVATFLGANWADDSEALAATVERLAADQHSRREQSRRGQQLIDGEGVVRVSAELKKP